MLNALFAFEDRHAGESAARRMQSAGLRSSTVEIHAHDSPATKPISSEVDELVTGGGVHSFVSLLWGIFDWSGSPHDAAEYARTVSRGGAVLSVTAETDEDREAIDSLMREAKADNRTDWRDPAPL